MWDSTFCSHSLFISLYFSRQVSFINTCPNQGLNPGSSSCEAKALTTDPSHCPVVYIETFAGATQREALTLCHQRRWMWGDIHVSTHTYRHTRLSSRLQVGQTHILRMRFYTYWQTWTLRLTHMETERLCYVKNEGRQTTERSQGEYIKIWRVENKNLLVWEWIELFRCRVYFKPLTSDNADREQLWPSGTVVAFQEEHIWCLDSAEFLDKSLKPLCLNMFIWASNIQKAEIISVFVWIHLFKLYLALTKKWKKVNILSPELIWFVFFSFAFQTESITKLTINVNDVILIEKPFMLQ